MADGKIIIDTAINTKGFEEGGRELENAGQKVAASMDEIMRSVNDSFSGIDTKAVVKQFETLDDVVERAMSKIASAATSTTGADAAADRSVTIPKSSMGYDRSAIEAIENYSAGIDDATQGINEMLAALKAAEEEVKRLEGVGKFFGDAEYDDAVLKLQKVKADVVSYKRELADAPRAEFLDRIAQSAQVADQKIVDLKLELDSLKARQQNLSAAGITYGYEEFDRNAARIAEINRELNTYAKRVSAAEGKNATYTASNTRLGKSLDSSKKKVSGLSKSFKQFSANNALKQGLTSVFKYAFGVQSLFRLFNQIRAYIGEGINNLVQFDGATNKSVSNIKSAMTTLKNSLATAFAPILTVVEPIITRFINMLSTAATYIGYFFAALSGQKTFTRAVAVQEDYAASLNDTASAAGSAADAVKELTNLSGLDEINKFQEATPATSGAGGGASGGVGVGQMFETVNLEDVFKPIDWKQAGKKVSEGFATILDTISSAIDRVDWKSIPDKVSKTITDFFTGFDWKRAFSSIGNLIGNAYKAVFEFKQGVFEFIREQIAKVKDYFLGYISPELAGLGEDASILDIGGAIIKGIFKGITDACKNIVIWVRDNVVEPFVNGFKKGFGINSPSKVMKEYGRYIMEGLFEGIEELFGDFDGLLSTIANKVSTLWNNIKRDTSSAWSNMKATTKSSSGNIKSIVSSDLNSIKQKSAEAWGSIRSTATIESQSTANSVGAAWSDTKSKTSSAWKSIKDILSSDWSSIRSNASSHFDGSIKNAIITGLSNTKTSASSKADEIKSVLSSAWSNATDKAKSGFTNLKDGVVNIMNNLKSAIKTPINGIIAFLNAMLSGLVSGINSAIKALNKISVTVPSWVPTYGGRTFGFSIKTISTPSIPYLAAGAVIPPNAPFMAMLGDQKRGNNLEAPEGLIRRIVREESGSGGNTYNVSARANGRTIFEMVIEEGKRQQSSTGRNPFELAY